MKKVYDFVIDHIGAITVTFTFVIMFLALITTT